MDTTSTTSTPKGAAIPINNKLIITILIPVTIKQLFGFFSLCCSIQCPSDVWGSFYGGVSDLGGCWIVVSVVGCDKDGGQSFFLYLLRGILVLFDSGFALLRV